MTAAVSAAVSAAVGELAPVVGTKAACVAVGRARATHYRHQRRRPPPQAAPRSSSSSSSSPAAPRGPRALSAGERAAVFGALHSERFVDAAPPTVYATLLDEGRYLASVSTMYRLLRTADEVRERRRQAVHPARVKPELVATRPNEVWSWDITKLLGPVKWTYYYLYAVLDIFSRDAVGWMVAPREAAHLAERFLAETLAKQGIARDRLTVHADRGSSMASKSVALLLADLGVTKTHSRPRCSDDNPYSESHFKTLKYRPEFPERFGSLEDARAFCRPFFRWS
jgi:putative transposase